MKYQGIVAGGSHESDESGCSDLSVTSLESRKSHRSKWMVTGGTPMTQETHGNPQISCSQSPGGELDILEYANDESNKVTFHTDRACKLNVQKLRRCARKIKGIEPWREFG